MLNEMSFMYLRNRYNRNRKLDNIITNPEIISNRHSGRNIFNSIMHAIDDNTAVIEGDLTETLRSSFRRSLRLFGLRSDAP